MILLFGSCDQLEDRNYDAGPEKVYPPRVLNTQGYSGYKRAVITWDFSANNINTAKGVFITITAPEIEFNKAITIDSLISSYEVKDLQTDVNYTITVQTMDSNGNLSIINPSGGQTAYVFVYGDMFYGLNNVQPHIVKGAGICVVDFKNENEYVLNADISFNDIVMEGKSAYYIPVVEGSIVNVSYSDHKFYTNAAGNIGIDAIKVPKNEVIAVSSNYKLTDNVNFEDKVVKSIAGSITYDTWQNKTTSLTLSGAIKSFNDLYLCRSLETLTLDATGEKSTTSPDVAPINFLIGEGTLKKIIIADEQVYNNIKSKIIDQSIISVD